MLSPPFANIASVQVSALEDRYIVDELLGEGRFSQVHAARRCCGPSGSSGEGGGGFALKVMDLVILHSDEEALEMLEAEVLALQRASEHEHLRAFVVKLHEVIVHFMPSYRRTSWDQDAPWAYRLAKMGDYSLDIYLLITGFLLTTSIVRHFRRTGALNWGGWALHRLLRCSSI